MGFEVLQNWNIQHEYFPQHHIQVLRYSDEHGFMLELGDALIDEFVGRALFDIFLGDVEVEGMIEIFDGALADDHGNEFLEEEIRVEFEDLFEVVDFLEVCETIA